MENKCFICEKTSDIAVYKENGFESRKCPECGLLYCNPLPQDGQVDLERDFHEETFYKMPAKYKAKWLARNTGLKRSLLEIGAGNGHLLKEFADCGYEVSGLEPSRERIQNIRNAYNIKAYHGALETYDFKLEKFDVIFHVDLLAHFPDPFYAVEKMKSIVEDDGLIGFEVGIIGGISRFWYRFFTFGLPQHRWLYSEKSLEKFLQQAKLVTLHKKTHSLAPYFILKKISGFILISVLKRLLHPLIGKKVSVLFNLHYKFSNFLRYQVGSRFPNWGPLTILILTKPV